MKRCLEGDRAEAESDSALLFDEAVSMLEGTTFVVILLAIYLYSVLSPEYNRLRATAI